MELKEKVVSINRVVKTTKGGRTFSFSALVVVGNGSGVFGHGLGKAKEVQEAIAKGIDDAKKNLTKVPVMHGTIPHEQLAKEGAAKVLIKPAAHGAGVIAGGSMRAVLESAGITDVLAKSLGSANPHNVVKATIKALGLLREPIQIAKTRNIKLSKVFNG
jgi:small subunit ribosomal protein S5